MHERFQTIGFSDYGGTMFPTLPQGRETVASQHWNQRRPTVAGGTMLPALAQAKETAAIHHQNLRRTSNGGTMLPRWTEKLNRFSLLNIDRLLRNGYSIAQL